MKTIKSINMWKSNNNEIRIYINFMDSKKQGIWFYTGNSYQKKGTLENVSIEELAEVKRLMNNKKAGYLTSVYENEIKSIDSETLDIISRNNKIYSIHNNKSNIE